MSSFQFPNVGASRASRQQPPEVSNASHAPAEGPAEAPLASPRPPLQLTHPIAEITDRGKRLYEAVRHGEDLADPAVLRGDMASRSGRRGPVEVDYRGTFSDTPLMTACARGNMREAKTLVAAGALVDATDKFGSTPLHYAARAGHLPILRLLLDAGANPSTTNKQGKTPLHVAHSDVQLFLHALAKAPEAVQYTLPPLVAPLPPLQSTTPLPVVSVRKPPQTARPLKATASKTLGIEQGRILSARDVPIPGWSLRLNQKPERFSTPQPLHDKPLQIGTFVLPEISPRVRDTRIRSVYKGTTPAAAQ